MESHTPVEWADVLAQAPGLKSAKRRLGSTNVRMRAPERKVLLYGVDVLILCAALALAMALLLEQDERITVVVAAYWRWFVVLTAVWTVLALILDAYNPARAATTTSTVRVTLITGGLTILVYSLIPRWSPPLQSRLFIFTFASVLIGGLVVWRFAYAKLFIQPVFKQRAVVVGAGRAGQTLVKALGDEHGTSNPFHGTGYVVAGFVDDNPALTGTQVQGLPVFGGHKTLEALVSALQIDEVIVAITHRHAIAVELFDALLRCRELGIRVTYMPVIYERMLGRVPVSHLGRDLQGLERNEESAAERLYFASKRAADFILAVLCMPVFIVLAGVALGANALKSPGPLFYRQRRVGKGGRVFEMVKFRSMVPNAEADSGPVWTGAHDDRVTPIGHLLRKTRLDELPQLLNVLAGDMSIIGPRPERPEFVETLAREIPFYRARHAVRPGITGWAQVRYHYGTSVNDALVKLEYDLYYVKHCSTLLDFRILLRTLEVMLLFEGQ